jgi:hypothetical protein
MKNKEIKMIVKATAAEVITLDNLGSTSEGSGVWSHSFARTESTGINRANIYIHMFFAMMLIDGILSML